MTGREPPHRFTRCEEIALEAARLYDGGHARAGAILLDQVRRTCLFKDDPCPRSGPCRRAVDRLERRLAGRE